MKVKELIELIKNSDEVLYHLDNVEDLIDGECKKVASGINPEEHRWYSLATDVYECEDGYVGVRAGEQLFSEEMSWSDVCPDIYASEYEAVQTITYRLKKITYRPKKCHS
jgi:hypothetical protein